MKLAIRKSKFKDYREQFYPVNICIFKLHQVAETLAATAEAAARTTQSQQLTALLIQLFTRYMVHLLAGNVAGRETHWRMAVRVSSRYVQ